MKEYLVYIIWPTYDENIQVDKVDLKHSTELCIMQFPYFKTLDTEPGYIELQLRCPFSMSVQNLLHNFRKTIAKNFESSLQCIINNDNYEVYTQEYVKNRVTNSWSKLCLV